MPVKSNGNAITFKDKKIKSGGLIVNKPLRKGGKKNLSEKFLQLSGKG